MARYVETLIDETFGAGLLLALLGLVGARYWRHCRSFAVVAVGCWCFFTLAFNALANLPLTDFYLGIQMRFWMQVALWSSRYGGRHHGVWVIVFGSWCLTQTP